MRAAQFLWLAQFFHKHKLIRWVAGFFATRVIYAYVALPFILVWFAEGREYIVAAGAGLILGWGFAVHLLAWLLPRARPYQKYGFKPGAGVGLFSHIHSTNDSFPSGHTTSLVILTLVAHNFLPWVGVVSAVVTILTALSRVVLGYHYITDILAGVAIGIVTVFALFLVGIL